MEIKIKDGNQNQNQNQNQRWKSNRWKDIPCSLIGRIYFEKLTVTKGDRLRGMEGWAGGLVWKCCKIGLW